MTMQLTVDDEQLDDMTETIGMFRELAHRVAHARERGDIEAISDGAAAMEELFRTTDRDVLAAALLERLFAADWTVCQDMGQLPHRLP